MTISLSALGDAAGKNVVVTGVAGIGGAFASLCLQKGAACVYLVDRDQAVLNAAVAAATSKGKVVPVLADVGTDQGCREVANAVGNDTAVHWVLLGAACPKHNFEGGLSTIAREDFDDMMRTDVHGKLFLIQALAANLKKTQVDGDGNTSSKARVFNLGAPFSDGPKPDGTYMIPPSWAAFASVKAANRWLHEGMKVDFQDTALFAYGHPSMTRTSLTEDVAQNYPEAHPMRKMVGGRFEKGDFHTPEEAASLFYQVFASTEAEEFQQGGWSIVRTYGKWGKELGVKETSDVAAGIAVPQAK